MEMRFIGNTDKKGRSNRRLTKTLAGVLLAVVMMATNFGGIVPGTAFASTDVYNLSDLGTADSNTGGLSVFSGNYILKSDLYISDYIVIADDTSIDLNGHSIEADYNLYINSTGTLNILDSSDNHDGLILNHLYIGTYGTLNIFDGTVEVSSNNGTITQTGGYAYIVNNYGTYTQTGGWNSNNKTITLIPNGGVLTSQSRVYTILTSGGEKLNVLPSQPGAPSANDTFDGWFTAADGGDRVTLDTVFTHDTNIYAHWTNTSASSGNNPPMTPNSATSSPSTTNTSDGEVYLENPSDDSTKDYLGVLMEKIEEAIKAGGAQTIYWNEGTALPGPVMKLLQENPQITLVFSYTYEGLDYVVTLPGKYVKYDPNVPWCGPLYLYGLYGKYGTTTAPVATTTQAGERSYTVISGETLWGIAMRLGTTVEELVRLNNITNPDRIDIGQIIRY